MRAALAAPAVSATAVSAEASAPLLALHPQAVPGQPQVVRWMLPERALELVGPVIPPGRLGSLLEEGILTLVDVEPAAAGRIALRTHLAARHHWRDWGAAVRAALLTALHDPAAWHAAPAAADQLIADDLAALLAGATGQAIRAHGGEATVLSVERGCVQVCLSGACQGCPAAASTLHQNLERSLQLRWPAASITAQR